jgi:hypothetical protein
MPEGLGTDQLGHPFRRQRHALGGLKVEPGANGLAATAITAVERLAATRGITAANSSVRLALEAEQQRPAQLA